MFEIVKTGTQFDFVGKRAIWIGLSIIAVLGTFVLFFTKGLNYGIDFTGGAEITLKLSNGWKIDQLRKSLETGGMDNLRIQQLGEESGGEFLVRAQGDEASLNAVSKKIETALTKEIAPKDFELQKVDVVGPAAGGALRKKGFISMFYALLAILVYVAFRFDTRYAPGAVLALFHDTVVVLGIFVITQKQFDLTILAAILALIGYSNNDTIIVFDRVRETIQLNPKMSIEDAVNNSVNQTLGRTLTTSFTTFLVCMSLWLFGGSVLENFAFTLMVGIVVGTYSSIFVASTLVIVMTKRKGQYAKVLASAKS